MPDQLLISVLHTVQAKLPGLGSGSCSLVVAYHMPHFGAFDSFFCPCAAGHHGNMRPESVHFQPAIKLIFTSWGFDDSARRTFARWRAVRSRCVSGKKLIAGRR